MIDYLHAKRGGRANENYPYGGTWTTSGTQQTDRLYTDQRAESAVLGALYDYGARHYDSALARFISPDSIVPSAGNPQALNRYAYTFNNPLKYIDPSGHDLILVPGVNTDDWWDNPSQWREWIIAYKGWTAEKFNEVFGKKWAEADAAGRQAIMEEQRIFFFDWQKCNCADLLRQNSTAASVETWGLGALASLLKGKSSITLVGHSKGGNLVLNFLKQQQKGTYSDVERPQNVALLDFPSNDHILPGMGLMNTSRSVRGVPVFVANVYNVFDPANHDIAGAVQDALNVQLEYLPPLNSPSEYHKLHTYAVYSRDLANLVLNGYFVPQPIRGPY